MRDGSSRRDGVAAVKAVGAPHGSRRRSPARKGANVTSADGAFNGGCARNAPPPERIRKHFGVQSMNWRPWPAALRNSRRSSRGSCPRGDPGPVIPGLGTRRCTGRRTRPGRRVREGAAKADFANFPAATSVAPAGGRHVAGPDSRRPSSARDHAHRRATPRSPPAPRRRPAGSRRGRGCRCRGRSARPRGRPGTRPAPPSRRAPGRPPWRAPRER
jgi:hypothetical protein